jgi:glyoxylase-like metal-dependent hydrolase (beta-lactamase superfamily II)
VVVCSHLHPDHCGCNAFFKRATVIIHAREIEAARAPGAEAQGYLTAEWDLPMRIDSISGGDRDVFGDGRIVLLHLPGHTPGSMSALVQLDRSGTMLLASDTVSLREALDGVLPKNTWNVEALENSLTEIRRIAATGATVICGHDDRQWQTLRKGADAYD